MGQLKSAQKSYFTASDTPRVDQGAFLSHDLGSINSNFCLLKLLWLLSRFLCVCVCVLGMAYMLMASPMSYRSPLPHIVLIQVWNLLPSLIFTHTHTLFQSIHEIQGQDSRWIHIILPQTYSVGKLGIIAFRCPLGKHSVESFTPYSSSWVQNLLCFLQRNFIVFSESLILLHQWYSPIFP